MEEAENVRISVRNLVEFILRSGDIDNRKGSFSDPDAMQMGSRLHRKIQGRMGSNYQPEVFLTGTCPFPGDGISITVEGRADGIIQENSGMTVDEIKWVLRSLEYLTEPVPVHLAQAKCYAFLYALSHGQESMGVQMTYCNLETEEVRRFRQEYSMEALQEWFDGVIGEYRKWAVYQLEWRKTRQDSIRKIQFPFPYREGQRDLAAAVYRTIARKKKLFIQAPTGAGKTITTIFPAVKAVGEGLGDKIFYLTAKTIARTVAEEAFGILEHQGLRYKTVTLTAREKICCCEQPECNPRDCPRAKGHFDRINDAVYDMITHRTYFGREALEEQARQWNVCPFELSLDVALWVDAVICDYNYVFDPRVRLKRFFADGIRGDYLFLIDEAHNLVERGREMFSASLYKEDFLSAGRAVKAAKGLMSSTEQEKNGERLIRALERCNRQMLVMKRECEGCRILDHPGVLPVTLMNLCGVMEKFLEDSVNAVLNEQILELYFQVQSFLHICDRLDECYVIYTELTEDGRFHLRLYCVDPSVNLEECLNKGRSTVFFSATLLPVDYYKSLLSTEKDDYAVYAKSCFDAANLKLLIGTDTSSRYRNRSLKEYQKIASYIKRAIRPRKGNYLVFFSSYRMLEDVAQCFKEMASEDTGLLCQTGGMSEADREEFLRNFDENREKTLVGFCVMGSIFGEGIDLRRDRLIGAIIVGTGLPQVCNERELLKNYYSKKQMDGFHYAYRCPGMNKVLQAAGRVIRTEEDRGIVLLLDERFAEYQYRRMFPREWAQTESCTVNNIEEKIRRFWENR